METITVTRSWRVSGTHCGSCGILIDGAVEELHGVASSTTSVNKQVTTVTFDPAVCLPDEIARTILAAGYQLNGGRQTPPTRATGTPGVRTKTPRGAVAKLSLEQP